MDLMTRRRAIMGMPSGKDYTVSGNVVSISNALTKNAKSLIVSFSPKQSGSGDPSPSNVRPISGYTDIGAVRYGKNLCPVAEDSRTVHWGTNQNDIRDAINELPAGTYTVTVKYKVNELPTGGVGYGVYATKSSGILISYSIITDNNPTVGKVYTVTKTFTLAEADVGTCTHFYLYCDNATTHSGTTGRGSYSAYDFQIEAGNTATQYEPYISPVTANVHSDTTLFGGTVDLVSGECIVDRVSETITGNSNWYSFYTGTGNSSAVVQLNHGVKYTGGYASYNGAIGSSGREAQNYWTSARENEVPNEGDMAFAYSSTRGLRVHRTDVANITDLASFKSAFVDLQICYPLLNPIYYQLTPSQLALLKGNNTVYSNEGSISLTYVGK